MQKMLDYVEPISWMKSRLNIIFPIAEFMTGAGAAARRLESIKILAPR
jgi:hypothetical protein